MALFLNGKPTDSVLRTNRVAVSFDDEQEPWHWWVNPVIWFGLTEWDGNPRGFMIKPFIDGPCLADQEYLDEKNLVCAQVGRSYYSKLYQGRIRVIPANVRLDFDRRQLVIIKPYTKLIKY